MRVRQTFPIFFLLVAALALDGCAKKRLDPTDAAKQFFELISAGRFDEAYKNSAFGFQMQQSEKAFAQKMGELDLLAYQSAQWEPAEIQGREAKVHVEITTKKAKKVRFVATLLDESRTWRVFSLRFPRSVVTGVADNHFSLVGKGAAFTEALSRPVPDKPELDKLVFESLLLFNDAIQRNSFDDFYAKVSAEWQQQLTLGQLHRAFQRFVDRKVNIAGITEAEVVLDEPAAIGTDGLLLLRGHFPTEPYQVYFSLQFRYELPKWRLFGLDVAVRPPASRPAKP